MRRRMASAYLSSLVSISLVLFLVGAASLLLVNAKGVSDYFKKNVKISVILKTGVTEDQAREYQKSIDQNTFAASSEFISRERGEEELKALLGEDFLDVFETSPVPLSVEVAMKPEYVSPDSVKVASSILGQSPLVDEVVWQQTLVEALSYNLGRVSAIISILILLLLFISFVLISNTIRLNVYDRRFAIHTMKLVGAARSFIRKPFLVKSAFMGVFAALIAIIMLIAMLFVLKGEIPQLFELFSPKLLLLVMGIVIGAGLVICLVSTFFVVNKLIKLHKSELYY
ncbi:MAG: permease-like cell division protein FtsX [Bacteroidales bacterium]|nr:permease-like cell division protein FtsX [Bacteroidales bacterium]